MTPREAFAFQAQACRQLGSEFMGQLMGLAADRLDTATAPERLALEWPGDPHPSADSVPLRLAGALHWLVLTGRDPALAQVYPPHAATDDALWRAVAQALEVHGDAIVAFMASPPQTNEIRRAAAIVPMLHAAVGPFGLPVMLSELGASAGLNLRADQFYLEMGGQSYGPSAAHVRLAPECEGAPPPPVTLHVDDRAGVDLRPFDLSQEAQQSRLLAYLWPDQPERLSNTRAALQLAHALPAPVTAGDAIDWLETRLSEQTDGQLHVIYHTVAWQYFPRDVQARGEAMLAKAGKAATDMRPLARISMEADGQGAGAAMTLTMWPDGMPQAMGRVDFHGRWINWEAPQP